MFFCKIAQSLISQYLAQSEALDAVIKLQTGDIFLPFPDLLEKKMKLLGLVSILLAQQLLTVAYEKDATCFQELMDSLAKETSSSGDP